MAEQQYMTDDELRLKAIEVLNKALGPTAAARFLSMVHRDRTDYVHVSRELYEGQTIDEIFDRASKSRWRL